jgi:hypothetical protein
MFKDVDGRLWFRQSWLKEFLDCPERARLKAVTKDQPRQTSDAALIGTSVHTAIQGVLEGRVDATDIEDACNEAVLDMLTTDDVVFNKYEAEQLPGHARRCARAWVDGILPHVELGGTCEKNFSVVVMEIDGIEVGLTGTIDYMSPTENTLWDWKTAGKRYSQKQYQKGSIQASTYATAMSLQKQIELPMNFNFGVMVRSDKNASSQIVTVERRQEHSEWFLKQLGDVARFAIRFGTEDEWAKNEESYLCSKVWCNFYADCRGKYISEEADGFVG